MMLYNLILHMNIMTWIGNTSSMVCMVPGTIYFAKDRKAVALKKIAKLINNEEFCCKMSALLYLQVTGAHPNPPVTV